jgi:eukaryotic-like serine/threonine-protein kinase
MRFRQVERLCAIKEMQVSAPNDKTRALRIANFEREAEMLATLNHPAVPKIYDFFSNGGLIYLVLEYIDGEDLENFIDRQDAPLAEPTLIEWALEILDVLS